MEMKSFRISRICLLFIMLLGLFLFAPMAAKAANPTEAELQPDKLYKSYDLTGNGKKDRIKIKTSKDRYYDYKTVSIIINGKRRAVYKDVNDITAKIYTLKNGKPFLYLWMVEEDWEGPACGIFQYKSGKLKQVINCRKFFSQKSEYGGAVHGSDIKVKGNTMTVDFWLMSYTVGGMSCRYRFEYKNGTLKRTSSQTSSVKVGGAESTGILTAAKSMKVYITPAGKKVRYTLKSGKRIKVIGAYVKSENFSLKVKNLSNGKTGWIKCLKKYPSDSRPPFKEVIYSG